MPYFLDAKEYNDYARALAETWEWVALQDSLGADLKPEEAQEVLLNFSKTVCSKEEAVHQYLVIESERNQAEERPRQAQERDKESQRIIAELQAQLSAQAGTGQASVGSTSHFFQVPKDEEACPAQVGSGSDVPTDLSGSGPASKRIKLDPTDKQS